MVKTNARIKMSSRYIIATTCAKKELVFSLLLSTLRKTIVEIIKNTNSTYPIFMSFIRTSANSFIQTSIGKKFGDLFYKFDRI